MGDKISTEFNIKHTYMYVCVCVYVCVYNIYTVYNFLKNISILIFLCRCCKKGPIIKYFKIL